MWVLNLVIRGIPSIPINGTFQELQVNTVLNLVLIGLPSIWLVT